MARLATLGARVAHQPFTKAIWDQLKATTDYLVVPGADIAVLGGGNTLTIAAEWHKVTLATGLVDTITDALGASTGQPVELFFTNSQTIRNNGGGIGNIRTHSGKDTIVPPNVVVTLVYDGAVWREQGAQPGEELDFAQVTSATTGITASTEATAVAIVTGNSITYDGTKVRIEASLASYRTDASTLTQVFAVLLRDATVLGTVAFNAGGTTPLAGQRKDFVAYDTPAAGAHTYKLSLYVTATATHAAGGGAGGSGGVLLPAFLRVTRA